MVSTPKQDSRERGPAVDKLRMIPEHVLKGLADWFIFIATRSPATLRSPSFAPSNLTSLLTVAVTLLENEEISPGPVVAAKIISMLRKLIQAGGSTSGIHDLASRDSDRFLPL